MDWFPSGDCTDLADNDADGLFDCDDSRADVYPGAPEFCDGIDNDCDEEDDEDAVDAGTWYVDWDGDGFGDPLASDLACEWPDGHVMDSSDCDDVDLDGVCGAEGEEGGVLDEMWKRTLNLPYDTNISLGYGSDAPTDPAACDSF